MYNDNDDKIAPILILLFAVIVFVSGVLIGAAIGNTKGFTIGYDWAHRVEVCYSISAIPLRNDGYNKLLFNNNSIVCKKENTIYIFQGRPRHYNLVLQFDVENENK